MGSFAVESFAGVSEASRVEGVCIDGSLCLVSNEHVFCEPVGDGALLILTGSHGVVP
jgi:hypothetical protein